MVAEEQNLTPGGDGAAEQDSKVLDQSSAMTEAFDESILAEIENRLENGDDQFEQTIAVGDKVELDRADLPLDGFLPDEQQTEPKEVEVDLADQEIDLDAGTAEDGESLSSGGAKGKLMAALAVLAVIVVAGGVGYWFSARDGGEKPKQEEATPWVVRNKMPDMKQALRLELEPFTVPLLGSDQGQILRVMVMLETMDSECKQELTERSIDLRDIIYRSLRDRPAAELQQAKKSRLLQAQIKAQLNHAFGKEWVHRVFFTQFLISG